MVHDKWFTTNGSRRMFSVRVRAYIHWLGLGFSLGLGLEFGNKIGVSDVNHLSFIVLSVNVLSWIPRRHIRHFVRDMRRCGNC